MAPRTQVYELDDLPGSQYERAVSPACGVVQSVGADGVIGSYSKLVRLINYDKDYVDFLNNTCHK